MRGTAHTPDRYTRTTGNLKCHAWSDVHILCVCTQVKTLHFDPSWRGPLQQVMLRHFFYFIVFLSENCYFFPGPGRRRSMAPYYLVTRDKKACDTLEDTLQGKPLFYKIGEEILSTDLSYFEYSDALKY